MIGRGLEFFAMSTARQNVVLQMLATRQHAQKLLASLLRAQAECDQQLQREQRSDAMRSVTGCSSIDRAVASTRRMIEQLDRGFEQVQKELDQDAPTPPSEPPTVPQDLHLCDVQVVIGSARVRSR